MKPEAMSIAYEDLCQRALEVVSEYGTNFHAYVSEKMLVRITISGDVVTLHYPELEREYDDSYLKVETVQFPLELLEMSDEQFKEWKKQTAAEYKRGCEHSAKIHEQQRQAQERAAYEMLKKKFG